MLLTNVTGESHSTHLASSFHDNVW